MVRILAVLLLPLCLAGCFADEKKEERAAQKVRSQVVRSAQAEGARSYSGVVRGRYESQLAFQASGRILSRNVEAGAKVRAGDVLMVIDARDAVQQANAGQAAVEAALAQRRLAAANLARYRELYEEEAIPRAVLDQYQTAFDAAQASYESALSQAQLGQNVLSYTNLRAGADGVVADVMAEEGQVVAAGQPVVKFVQDGEREVTITVPEQILREISAGMETEISYWALKEKSVGIVREIDPVATDGARTYRIRVAIVDPPKDLQLGMTAGVRFAGQGFAGEGLVRVPITALYEAGAGAQVWLVEDDMVSLHSVQVERFDGNDVLVRNLPAGSRIVKAGVHRLRERQKVRAEDEE